MPEIAAGAVLAPNSEPTVLPNPAPTASDEAATNYVLRKTGCLDLNGWTDGAYWTHCGPCDCTSTQWRR